MDYLWIDKTIVVTFNLKYFQHDPLQAFYKCKKQKVTSVTYLGFGIDKHLHWKIHIEQVIRKLKGVSNAVRFMYHFINVDMLKMA
jgi:hypothetical protein